jgi:hypothetical protein
MAIDNLPKELALMILHCLDNRHDRTTWRLLCKCTNDVYLKERERRANECSKRYDVGIKSDEAILRTLVDFRHWTSISHRITDNAYLSARLLWENLDDPKCARERTDHGEDRNSHEVDEKDGFGDVDENVRQREVNTVRRRTVDTLRTYVGD